jgi:hypothetical protein
VIDSFDGRLPFGDELHAPVQAEGQETKRDANARFLALLGPAKILGRRLVRARKRAGRKGFRGHRSIPGFGCIRNCLKKFFHAAKRGSV